MVSFVKSFLSIVGFQLFFKVNIKVNEVTFLNYSIMAYVVWTYTEIVATQDFILQWVDEAIFLLRRGRVNVNILDNNIK